MNEAMRNKLWDSMDNLKGAIAKLTDMAIDAGTVSKELLDASSHTFKLEHLLFESKHCKNCKEEGLEI